MFEKNWLVHKIIFKELANVIQKYGKGILLDIGCGEKPYKELTIPFVEKHIGLDHINSLHSKSQVDLFGTAYEIPLKENSVDTILCTAVLEHLEEPDKALKEANRVLKKNGYAIYTVPLFWHIHEEPRDFFRYTEYGLKYLFEKNNFEIVELKPLSGFWVTFGQEFVYYLWTFRRGGKLNPLYWIISIIGSFIQFFCYIINKIDNSKQFTWMYLIIAKKL